MPASESRCEAPLRQRDVDDLRESSDTPDYMAATPAFSRTPTLRGGIGRNTSGVAAHHGGDRLRAPRKGTLPPATSGVALLREDSSTTTDL